MMPTIENVPTLLQGVWERRWIENADGSRDDTSTVVWLQFESEMVDVRFTADRYELATRGSLDGCDLADLIRLSDTDSSSGYTTCTPLVGTDGVRSGTAQWFSDTGIAVQPQTLYPEAGALEWNADGSVMTERAPSGAYVEEWHLVPSTGRGAEQRRTSGDGYELFVIGPVAVEVIDRRDRILTQGRLDDIISSMGDDLDAARRLLDCEFSLAYEQHGQYLITASTHPWRIGQPLAMEPR